MKSDAAKRIESINNGIIPEGYKKTKVGIVPVEWETKQMKNICEINRGGSPRPIENFLTDEENGINWIKIGDTSVDSKYITHTKEKIKPDGIKKTRQVFEGDFLLSNSMSYGRPYILKTSGCIHDGWLVISNYSSFLNLDFFYYLLCHDNIQRQYDMLSAGSGVQNLNKDLVAQVNICIPPLPEQQKIAEILSTQDKLIELHERKINQLKTLKKGYMQKMFPKKGSKYPELRFKGFTDAWEQREFGNIAQRMSETSSSSDELPYIEYEDVISNQGILNKDVSTKEGVKTGIVFSEEDVLYGKLRPYLHNWLNPDFKGVAVGDWWVLKPINVDKNFLYRLIQSENFDNVANQSTGTKMPRADWKLVSATEFCMPKSLEEQAEIGQYFTNLDHLITLHQRKLDEEKQKKKVLMQLLLTGKVRCI